MDKKGLINLSLLQKRIQIVKIFKQVKLKFLHRLKHQIRKKILIKKEKRKRHLQKNLELKLLTVKIK